MLCMQQPRQAAGQARRLLQESVIYGAAAAPSSLLAAGGIPMSGNYTQFPDDTISFSPSVVIIIVVLLSAFFFMGFFSLYVRRCADAASSDGRTSLRRGAEERPNQGVDPDILHTLPIIPYSSAKKKGNNVECAVCLSEFEEQEPLRQLPVCKHVFHQDCIDMWLFSHSTCPLCRKGIAERPGSMSFRWGGGSGSFQHLPFLSRGGSAAQNLSSGEELGTVSLIESNRNDTMNSIRRSISAEMTNVHAFAGNNGSTHVDTCARRSPGLHLVRANSTGHCLHLGLASEANAQAVPIVGTPDGGLNRPSTGLYRSISEMPKHEGDYGW